MKKVYGLFVEMFFINYRLFLQGLKYLLLLICSVLLTSLLIFSIFFFIPITIYNCIINIIDGYRFRRKLKKIYQPDDDE